jgi:hypothetical protein
MKTIFKVITVLLAMASVNACNYLDLVPDDVPTIEHAFNNRTEAEKSLYGCYGYCPQIGDIYNDPAMTGGDETWQNYVVDWPIYTSAYIGRGLQRSDNPYLNFWEGLNGGKPLWRGIRDCNIFLENIDRVMDMPDYEKTRWKAEVKFLKAYYHYYLLKCYGPIPVVDVNLPISASIGEVKLYREPVDRVVEYISNLILEAVEDLPDPEEIMISTESGRVDKLAALSIRAELLLFAASDLFNGNTDYARVMVDNKGVELFNQTYDPNKWKIAADACKEVIDLCHEHHKELYDLVDPLTANAPEVFQLQTTYRQAICDKWNKELIWGATNYNYGTLASASQARLMRMDWGVMMSIHSQWSPTMKLVESYYSSNGVPIEEDNEWQQNGWYSNRYGIREEPAKGIPEIYYVREGQQTAYLHYKREPRFYASIGFDRGIYFGNNYYEFPVDANGSFAPSNISVKWCEMRNPEYSGYTSNRVYPLSGYTAKKMHSFKTGMTTNTNYNPNPEFYPFPIMRLANLYLMYAEALNEFSGPSDEIYFYLDRIRERAGLEGVLESWEKYSNDPGKPTRKEGLRSIIRQERTIELAMEGKRFWDIRRWKDIGALNSQPRGWNTLGETVEDFYRVVEIARVPVEFTAKDYFWPISTKELIVNRNLVPNPWW